MNLKRYLRRLILRKSSSSSRPAWWFGGCPMPLKAATEHTLVVGTTGSGKTIVLRSFERDLLPLVANDPNVRALIFDAKRDTCSFLATLGLQHRAVILNPFDLRAAQWDMAADIDTPGSAAELALRLVPEENDSNPYFARAARHIVKEVVTALHLRAPGIWTFRDLVLACRDTEVMKAILDLPRTKHVIAQYFNEKANIAAILSTLSTKFAPHEVVAACWHRSSRRFSLRKYLKSNYILLLPNDEAHHASIDPLNQLMFKRLSELVLEFGVSDTRRSFFFLDEYREMGKIEGLRPLLNLGRAFGVCVFMGYQSHRGVESVFTEPEADEIAGLCAQRVFLRLQDSSADWASKCLGEEEVIVPQPGVSNGPDGTTHSTTFIRTTRPIVPSGVIRDTPLPTPQSGLLATFDCSRIGVWQVVIPFEQWPPLPTEEAKRFFPDFVPRPVEHQVLEPWADTDYARLKIKRPPPPAPRLRLKPGAVPTPLPRPITTP